MEYYLHFREAIFHPKVGYQRITHPFAAIRFDRIFSGQVLQKIVQKRSLDLHA